MIKIITDTIFGLSLEKAKELGIHVIPQIVFFGEDSYRDDTELDTQCRWNWHTDFPAKAARGV